VVAPRAPGLDPVALCGRPPPPGGGAARGLLIDAGVVQKGVLSELRRRLERLDLKQSRQLVVKGLPIHLIRSRRHDRAYLPLNGTTGSTVRPKVALVTAANDAYHAAAAVASPR